ncbi:MAG TPA: Ig-like domain-containing protein [Bacillaceae bacterium]
MKKALKPFAIVIVMLLSGLIHTAAAIAAELVVNHELEIYTKDGIIDIVQGEELEFYIKLSPIDDRDGNMKHVNASVRVHTQYYLDKVYSDTWSQPMRFTATTEAADMKVKVQTAAQAKPGIYRLPVHMEITNSTANSKLNNRIPDFLIFNVLPKDTAAPVVSITNPADGGHYQSSKLPASPEFTVVEEYDYTTRVTGWSKAEGTHTVTITATDSSGNVGKASSTYTVDDTPPMILTKLADGGVYSAHALRDIATNYYTIEEPHLDKVQADELNLTDGTHTAVVTAVDKAGNTSEKSITYTVDNIAPAISFAFEDGGFYTSDRFSAFDPYYHITDGNLDNSTIEADVPGLSEGTHSVTVKAGDKAGNHGSATASYTIDDTAPDVSIHLEDGKYYSEEALRAIGEFYEASDLHLLSVDANGFGTTDGRHRGSVTATDKAGNTTVKTVQYHVDTIAPVIVIDEEKLADGGYYQSGYLEKLKDFYRADDANLAEVTATPLEMEDGTYIFTITAVDKAGNSSVKTIRYTVDNIAPDISFNLEQNGIYRSDQLSEDYFAVQDANGVISITADRLATSEGTHILAVTAMDAAGNHATRTITYTVDDTKPAVVFHLADGAHYTAQALQEALAGHDTYYTVTDLHLTDVEADELRTEEGNHEVKVTAKDAAGNTTAAFLSYTVDNTAPVISGLEGLFDGQRFLTGQNVDVTPLVSDNLDSDPMVQFERKLDTSTAGIHTYTVTAVDRAGNASTYQVTYHVYDFGGVEQPVNRDGTSIFKKNSTIPIKFAITAGVEAVNDARATLRLVKVSDNVVTGEAEAVSTSAATTGNLFRVSDSKYIFNLGTKTLEPAQYKAVITIELDGNQVVRESPLFSIRK